MNRSFLQLSRELTLRSYDNDSVIVIERLEGSDNQEVGILKVVDPWAWSHEGY
jgi:hypothetical protein